MFDFLHDLTEEYKVFTELILLYPCFIYVSWQKVSQYLKKKLHGPFLWMGFNCLKARATSRRLFTFYHYVPRNCWYSLYWPWKDERLSQPWSHPVALNTGPLDWESLNVLTHLFWFTVWIKVNQMYFIYITRIIWL